MQNWCLTGCVCDLSQGRGLCPLRTPAAGAAGALPLRKCMLQPAARPADPLGGRGAPVALALPRWGGGGWAMATKDSGTVGPGRIWPCSAG